MASGIRSIAKHLGVSVSTVSAVINGNGYVSREMRERIENYLRATDYQPNYVARSLRRRETKTVGLVVPDLSNSFYSQLCRGAEDFLLAQGYQLIVADSRENWDRQSNYLTSFCRMMVDGILLVPSLATDEQIASIPGQVRGRPMVYVDRTPANPPVDTVMIDNREASRVATWLLIKQGHTQIGAISEPLNLLNADERLDGFLVAMAEAGLGVNQKLVRSGENSKESGFRIGLEMLDVEPRMTAVLVCNNQSTLGFLAALRQCGIGCPEQVSVIGFDDCEWSELIEPPLTTIQAPATEMGSVAARTLLGRIANPNGPPPSMALLGFELRERSSSGPPGR
jgi:DNA-binding LacI/PurR family transcriptional regulator